MITRYLSSALFLLVVACTFSACENEKSYSYTDEMEKLKAYMVENNISATATSSGLYYIETQAGTGAKPAGGNQVKVKYKGYLLNGFVFDESTDGFSFVIGYGSVIQGWEEGIQYMREGGKAKLIVPSFMAYGSRSTSTIPAYSTLIFDVELIDISK